MSRKERALVHADPQGAEALEDLPFSYAPQGPIDAMRKTVAAVGRGGDLSPKMGDGPLNNERGSSLHNLTTNSLRGGVCSPPFRARHVSPPRMGPKRRSPTSLLSQASTRPPTTRPGTALDNNAFGLLSTPSTKGSLPCSRPNTNQMRRPRLNASNPLGPLKTVPQSQSTGSLVGSMRRQKNPFPLSGLEAPQRSVGSFGSNREGQWLPEREIPLRGSVTVQDWGFVSPSHAHGITPIPEADGPTPRGRRVLPAL